jgi:hypothetical protein
VDARSYLRLPALPLFARARTIRDQAFVLLAGHQHPTRAAISTRRLVRVWIRIVTELST